MFKLITLCLFLYPSVVWAESLDVNNLSPMFVIAYPFLIFAVFALIYLLFAKLGPYWSSWTDLSHYYVTEIPRPSDSVITRIIIKTTGEYEVHIKRTSEGLYLSQITVIRKVCDLLIPWDKIEIHGKRSMFPLFGDWIVIRVKLSEDHEIPIKILNQIWQSLSDQDDD